MALRQMDAMSEEKELRIAVLGSINAGKSTLLNALIGAELLPSAPRIETASIAEVRHDESLEPGKFVCSAVVGKDEKSSEVIFGEYDNEPGDSHTKVLDWVRNNNRADGMPCLTIRTNLTTAEHYTSLGLGGISLFDVPGTNEAEGQEDREREVGKVLARAHFVCIIVSKDDIGAKSVEDLGALVKKFTKPSCQVGLFVNKMDDVEPDERKGIETYVQDEVYNEEKRKEVFGRPITFYFTMGKVALHSACRGCDLKACKLIGTHYHCVRYLPLDEQDAQRDLNFKTLKLIRTLDKGKKDATELHDQMADTTRKISGIEAIWQKLVLDMLRARIQMAQVSLDMSSESVWAHADFIKLKRLAKFAKREVEMLVRILLLQNSYKELKPSLDRAAESHKIDVNRLRKEMNDSITRRVSENVTSVLGTESWNDAPTEPFEDVASFAVEELAKVVQRQRKEDLCNEVDAGTREGLQALLEDFIGDAEALQSHVPDKDYQTYLDESISEAVRSELRSFEQLSKRFAQNDWTVDETHVALSFQPCFSASFPKTLGDAPVWFPSLQSTFRKAASSGADQKKSCQRLTELSGSTIKSFFDDAPALRYFVLNMYPVITEAASWYETVKRTLKNLKETSPYSLDPTPPELEFAEGNFDEWWRKCLDPTPPELEFAEGNFDEWWRKCRPPELEFAEGEFDQWWIKSRDQWFSGCQKECPFPEIGALLRESLKRSHEKRRSSEQKRFALFGAAVGAAMVGVALTGGGLLMGAAALEYGAAASSIFIGGSGAGALSGYVGRSVRVDKEGMWHNNACQECQKELQKIYSQSLQIILTRDLTTEGVDTLRG